MEIKDYIAVYAAVVSTASLGWNIYLALTNRGRLSVRCRLDSPELFEVNPGSTYLAWTLTNNGRQPLMVESVGEVYRTSKHFGSARGLPQMLAPAEQAIVYSWLGNAELSQVSSLVARDTNGHQYMVPAEDLQELKAQVREGTIR